MNKKFLVIAIIAVLLVGLIGFYSYQKIKRQEEPERQEELNITVCADGKLVFGDAKCQRFVDKNITLDPNEFASIVLEDEKTNFVKSNGEIKTNISFEAYEAPPEVWMTIDKVNSPNPDFNKEMALPFIYYNLEVGRKEKQREAELNLISEEIREEKTGKEGEVLLVSVKVYLFNFSAPEIPGEYKITFSEPFKKEYNITVINEVENELIVYKIADRFIFSKLIEGNIKNWHVILKEINLKDSNWEINLQIEYDSCGVDWESDVCVKKTVKGHYLINKQTGIIIG